MNILFLIIGIVIGAVVAWLAASLKIKSYYENSIKTLSEEISIEKGKYIKAEAKFMAHKTQFESLEKQFKDSFSNMAAKAVQENNKSFLNLAEKTLEKYTVQASNEMENGSQRIQNILKPLNSSLEKHEKLIHQLETHNNQTYGSLKNHIEELIKKQNSLEKETGALVTALKSPKVRGKWGEVGLKRIVEFAGMAEYCHFEEQKTVKKDDSVLRPDMVVYLPENRKVVVDSKLPLLAYLNSLEESDEKRQEELIQAHTAAVRKHVRDLSSKSYWSQFDETVDFVVLYIEVESAFGTAMAHDKDLISKAIKNRILFATPTTLITLLQTVAYTWRQHKATENAVEIWKQSKNVYERLSIFSDYLQKIGGNINTLVKTYNSTVGSWQARVIPGIKKLSELGAGSDKKKIEDTETIELQAREL